MPPASLDPTDWRRVNEIFHQALALPSAARPAFVRDACGGDDRVSVEVLSLLEAHQRSTGFLEQPAASSALVLESLAPSDSGKESLAGRQIGHYRIRQPLGEGGMGVVYLADDLRLGRTVALKVLPTRFAADPARRERMRREARAAAGLTHPGVATVYALEEIDGRVFIAGEYVPGETLREELARGPLAVDLALDTAIGIAEALAAAHDRGVVHRDLKPENVIRTPAGQIKILDFGLARLRDLPEDAAKLTGDGVFLGTPAYMSPEQIRHEPVDGRSDLFALGVVLYELVSGTHPFAGGNPASTIARILESDPARLTGPAPMASVPAGLVGELNTVVRRCLAKSPAARFASAHDVLAALERVRAGESATLSNAATPDGGGGARAMADPVWWWQFHQVATSVGYALLLIPLWPARAWIGGRIGLAVVLAGIVGAIVAATLRLHLWFTLKSYPSEWVRQRDHNSRWIRLADVLFVVSLGMAGVWIVDGQPEWAALFIGAAVTALLSFTIIEPATTRAAKL